MKKPEWPAQNPDLIYNEELKNDMELQAIKQCLILQMFFCLNGHNFPQTQQNLTNTLQNLVQRLCGRVGDVRGRLLAEKVGG